MFCQNNPVLNTTLVLVETLQEKWWELNKSFQILIWCKCHHWILWNMRHHQVSRRGRAAAWKDKLLLNKPSWLCGDYLRLPLEFKKQGDLTHPLTLPRIKLPWPVATEYKPVNSRPASNKSWQGHWKHAFFWRTFSLVWGWDQGQGTDEQEQGLQSHLSTPWLPDKCSSHK